MKPALLGAIGLSLGAVALKIVPQRTAARDSGTDVVVASSATPQPQRATGALFSIAPQISPGARRPLGSASLATRGQPSLGMVTVGGYVRAPGQVAFEPGDSLESAISRAGGATEFGALNRVKLIRDGRLWQFDLLADEREAIPLQPNDTIEVPQKMPLGR